MTTLAPESKAPSPLHKAIARHALSVFGGKPLVQAYHHDEIQTLSIDLLEVDDSPDDGLVSYSTLGLFEAELRHDDGQAMQTRIELCAEMPDDLDLWGNVLATAAFTLLRGGQAAIPGSVLPGCVAEYYPDTTVPHLYLCVPYSWHGGEFPRFEQDGVLVNWLQAVPISEAELALVERQGHEALEDALLEHEPDIYDLERDSVC
ncbi:suppressor of fused domain protein [Orrella sp. JC864]|uniref:suppressor of fused domain protein n=1 Tax=Orrella sp. JC864 TaxID=3120298 RepID=UPI0012BB7E3B